jgi:DNA-binding IclR family transcriptional regulator
MPQPIPKYRAPALDKGLDILELLAAAPTAMSMREIADRIGRSSSEIFRMMQVLEGRGYIARDAGDSFALTNRLFILGMERPPVRSMVETAFPVMHRLADRIRQPCHLVVPSQEQIVVIARVDAPGDLGFVVRVGHRRPLENSTSGLVLFAFQNQETRERWLAMLTKGKPTTNLTGFVRRASAVRNQGYASAPSKMVDGVVDLSAPLIVHDHAVGALTIPFIERRSGGAKVDEAVAQLCEAASEVSRQLTTYGAS